VQEAAAPLDAAGLKARGAARFKSGDVEGALAAYQLLLQFPEDQVCVCGGGGGGTRLGILVVHAVQS
jgi:hypothetical protein